MKIQVFQTVIMCLSQELTEVSEVLSTSEQGVTSQKIYLQSYVSVKYCTSQKKGQCIKSTGNDNKIPRKLQPRSIKSSTFSCSFQESVCDDCWTFAAAAAAAFCG